MKSRILIFFIISFLVTGFLSVSKSQEDISKLLEEYETAEVRKTVDETLGKVYVFSREDIENLQLNTVTDLLKLLPFGTVYPNGFGVLQYVFSSASPKPISYVVRIFLDGHELSSMQTSSPFLTYDEFPLDNIQKAEIYFTNSISGTSVENGVIIVNLYSKDPKKENVSILKGLMDNKKGYSVTFSDARQLTRNFGYFILVNKGEKKYDKLFVNSHNLDRNQKREHFYLKFNYIDTEVQISASHVDRGVWGGFSPNFAPDYGKMQSTDIFFSLSQKLLDDKSFKILISYDWQDRNYIEKNEDVGVYYLKYVNNQYGVPIYLNEDATFTKFILHMTKDFEFNKHFINTGITYQDYQQNARGKKIIYPSNVVVYDYEPDYEEEDHFISLFLNYKYAVNKYLSLFANGKLSSYDWYTNKDRIVFDKKLGFLFNKDKYNFKMYATQSYLPPPLIYIEIKRENLKPMRLNTLFLEGKYLFSSSQNINATLIFSETKNILIPTSQGYINNSKNYKSWLYSLEYNIKLKNNTLRVNGWRLDSINYNDLSSSDGINLILEGQFKKLNYFSTFLYRNSFKYQNIKVDDSYDLSLGATYGFKNGFSLKIKGENVLNSSAKAVFVTPTTSGTYQSFDRRFLISLEKVF